MFKNRILSGANLYGIWQRMPNSVVSEVLCLTGVDFVTIDMEHGAIDIPDLRTMVPVFHKHQVPVILRVPNVNPSLISTVLDLGMDGIMVPRIDNADDARSAVNASKFVPLGARGLGGACAADHFGDISIEQFIRQENDRVITIIQIETAQAMANLDSIVNVEGIDLFYIGPIDLSQSLGIPGQLDHPLLIETIKTIIKKVKSAGKPVGMHGINDEFIRFWNEQGVRYFTFGMDSALLKQSVRNVLHKLP
jgi:2-keto-3-deoxy-L-rhamnonate aldolase RhmA